MSKSKQMDSDITEIDQKIQLSILESKKNVIFENMQTIYDLAIDVQRDESKLRELIFRAANIENLRKEFEKALDLYNVQSLTLNPKFKISYQSWSAFEEMYCHVKQLLFEKNTTSALQSQQSAKPKPRLPPIELISFDGDTHKWPLFYQQFTNLVHLNPDLTDSEKIYYLIGKLTGGATAVCAGLSPTASNYNIIWEALVRKYEDNRALASSYFDQLLNFKQLTNSSEIGLESFLNNFNASVEALKQLKLKDLTDFLFLHLALRKLDSETLTSFELTYRKERMPTYGALIEFIQERSKAISRASGYNTTSTNQNKPRRNIPIPKLIPNKSFINTEIKNNCLCGSNRHQHLYTCPPFLKLSPHERYNFIKNNNYCINCLSVTHKTSACTSKRNCTHCNARHHSFLHFKTNSLVNHQPAAPSHVEPKRQDNDTANVNLTADVNKACSFKQNICNASLCNVTSNNNFIATTVLLGTAQVKVIDKNNCSHILRCLIDPGSQSDYITKDCCERLSLDFNSQSPYSKVQGIGGTTHSVLGSTSLSFMSRYNNEIQYSIQPLVIDRITTRLPDVQVQLAALTHVNNLPLADAKFYEPGAIDLLIGVNLYCEILLNNTIKGEINLPSAIETTLGYIIMGSAPINFTHYNTHALCAFNNDPLNKIVEKFWKTEEIPCPVFLSPDEQRCEELYTSSTTRNNDGSYSVDLLFKDNPNKLGNSFITAKNRYLSLEKKFRMSPDLHGKYNEIIRDYIDRGIISHVPREKCISSGYYLPQQLVIRDDKSSSKIRIVLNGSSKTDSGVSLNDLLHTGRNLQTDIFNILLNVRIYRIAFFADVKQMYLCIFVNEEHRKYQRILYRSSSDNSFETYQFNRVTFGLRSSPFIALRTLRQLAKDEGSQYPLAAKVLQRDVYMDDLVSSASSLDEAVETAEQLIQLFKTGGFDLVKWTSNCPELLRRIPLAHRKSEFIYFDDENSFKILGLRWLPASDVFSFSIASPQSICTKRNILSITARLYDVLGLVGPVILFAKLLIAQLWSFHIDWDEAPPSNIIQIWQTFIHELPLLSKLQFPRYMGIEQNSVISLVAFADASEKAYGCVIYSHVVTGNESPIVTLLCSKSRVASPKTKITLPRLELNGLVLLSKLIKSVYDSLSRRHLIKNIFILSDSEVALCWVSASPHRFNTYVANRIYQFQTQISFDFNLCHIPGNQNPADCISRGILPSQILEHDLWFQGPDWLSLPIVDWPIHKFMPSKSVLPEVKNTAHVTLEIPENPLIILSQKFSTWSKYLKSVVYVMRFSKLLPRGDIITANDLDAAETEIVKAIQKTWFHDEIKNLKKGKQCSPMLRKLFPIMSDNLLRVGGRLENSSLSYEQKHPALLPKSGHIINLLIDHYHRKYCHAGPQLLISILRQKFWILSARRVVRHRIHKCYRCFRLNPKPTFPVMADLPQCRLEQCNAFTHVGVDYSGALKITLTRKRGVRSQKAYLCLFVCLVTKALHLELAADLSSTAFINAFKRFIARRGQCKFLYSDNATNFVSSKAYFNELYTFLQSDKYYQEFSSELAKNRITWHMNAPTASHFGGIWESNIKSVKSLLFRIIGNQILTFEEMLTVLSQIEAVLNSRPLYAMSSDPSEPTALTPSHFLHTTPLNSLPATDLSKEQTNLLTRFSLMDALVQSFWKRFKSEYIHTLQMREKWNTPTNPITVGTVVVINIQNAPPLQWPLGVITKVMPGKDGVVRVAEVKTKTGVYIRPVVKLCPLPSQ